jgi:hypothetical protein
MSVMNSDQVRTVERVKKISIWLCWLIVLVALYLAFFTRVPQIIRVMIFLSAFVPYVIGQKYVTPWLTKQQQK